LRNPSSEAAWRIFFLGRAGGIAIVVSGIRVSFSFSFSHGRSRTEWKKLDADVFRLITFGAGFPLAVAFGASRGFVVV